MMGRGFGDGRLSSANEPPSELRLGLVAVGMVLVFLVFVLRLFQLQILEGADLASRSERNSVRTVRIEAPRGDIVDREGRVLATTRPAFRVQVIPNDVQRADFTYRVLGGLLERESDELHSLVGSPRGRRRFQAVVLEGDLSEVQLARVESNRYALPGVVTDIRPRRDYVEAEHAAHLLGTLGEIDAHQLAWDEFEGYRQGEVIGKFGIEERLESHLRGIEGGRNVVVDVAGREIDVIDEVQPVPGGRLVLTLDLDLQKAAEAAFASEDPDEPDKMGALIAIDPRNGDVLALVSRPTYDPNSFAGGIDPATWSILTGDEWNPLRNRAISGQYPPGSTYKAIVALAGLSEKKIRPEDEVFCPGYYRMGRRTYRCWKRGGHGDVNLEAAMLGSCDVYFYQLGVALGIDTIAKYARKLGLGRATGISLRGETSGLVPTKEWKERARGQAWIRGETVSASIGQGFNLVTPLQLGVAFAALANGGTVYRPRLVKRLETWDGRLVANGPEAEGVKADLDPHDLALVQQALTAVVNAPRGTGARARLPDVLVAGKTGTTQVVSLDLVKDMEPEEIPIRYRDHALFAAFAPSENAEIAVAVVVEHAGAGGGRVAAPIARKVLARYFEKKKEREAQADELEPGGSPQPIKSPQPTESLEATADTEAIERVAVMNRAALDDGRPQ
jgi:penicillin-binding protein 2